MLDSSHERHCGVFLENRIEDRGKKSSIDQDEVQQRTTLRPLPGLTR